MRVLPLLVHVVLILLSFLIFTSNSASLSYVIDAGAYHTCVLDSNRTKCWGFASFGRLGYENTINIGDQANEMGNNLSVVDLGSNFIPKQIVTGDAHTCALSTANKVKCFGYNGYGQLGYNDINNRGDEANEMGDSLSEVDLGSSFIPMRIVS
eukprot:482036_1